MITLPWPDPALNIHAKGRHWYKKAKATAFARQFAWAKCIEVKLPKAKTKEQRFYLRWQFFPPDKRRRDVQNVIGMAKAYADGIADHLGADDSKFLNDWPLEFSEPVKGGMITVDIAPVTSVSVPVEGIVDGQGNVRRFLTDADMEDPWLL